MNLVLNNPYRVIGVLVGASATQQNRHTKRIPKFIEAGEEVPEEFTEFSFPSLGEINLSIQSVFEATSKLSLGKDKMSSALFWFYKGNPITDEPAFDAIKEADLDKVINIWTKLTSNGEVSQRNASAYSNLGTLYLSGILEGTNTNEVLLEQGISLKLKFLESDFIQDFKALATDETFKTTKKDLQLIFLNQVQSEVDKNGGVTSQKFLEILNKQTFSAKNDFLKGFVQKPIEQIEKKIEITKKKVKENPQKAGEFGNELYDSTTESLEQVKSLLGISDIKFISISDKLANEILQCGINLFNHFHETESEVGEISLDLNHKAKSIAQGSIVKERISESIPIVEKYISRRPEREKQNIVREELSFITNQLDTLEQSNSTISDALKFANLCKNPLDKMKLKLGVSDDLYISMCTAVASNAQGIIVSVVNDAMDKRNKYVKYINFKNDPFSIMVSDNFSNSLNDEPPSVPEYSLEKMQKVIAEAWSATIALGSLEMSFKQKELYIKNKASLKGLYKQINTKIVFLNDIPLQKWLLIVVGIIVFLLLVAAIWGEDGLSTIFGIAAVIGVIILLGWLQSNRS